MTDGYKKYLKWCKENGKQLPPLTRTQWVFIEKLLEPDMFNVLCQVGNLEPAFKSVYEYAKSSK